MQQGCISARHIENAKMELAKKLEAQGWYLTEEGIKTLTTALGSEDPRKIIDEALNRDLRDIGGGALPTKRDDAQLAGKIVLQIQRVRNIAAPKCNEESKTAPRLLQLDLSDGQATLQALELESVPALSLNVAPGTKIYFRAEKLQMLQGFLLLRSNELQLLGGRVEALYEKWDLARTMLKYARSGRPLTGASAPPPWVPFGKKIDTTADRNFKSMTVTGGDKDKPAKENDEFNTMRSEAIAVASKAAVKKVFGGGGQNIIDHNVKKILDKGYTEEEARNALHSTRNNLERALFNLKRRRDAGGNGVEPPPMRGGRGERPGRESKRGASLKDEADSAKPAANATLFDFLTTKLPATETAAPETTPATASTASSYNTNSNNTLKQYNAKATDSDRRSSSTNVSAATNKTQGMSDRSRFENNISSSFAANRGGHSGAPRGGGRNRGTREERPPRGDRERGGAGFNERARKQEKDSNPRASEQQQVRSSHNRNEHNASKPQADVKAEQEAPTGKDQFNNRRGSERQSHRGGAARGGENGHASNSSSSGNSNRRRGNGAAAAASGGKGGNNANNSEEFNARLSKVVEETANLKISGPKREDRRKHGGGGASGSAGQNRQQSEQQTASTPITNKADKQAQRQQPPQQHYTPRQQSNANYSQLPNGYTYDPSKIMGFQSKETNEFAMSLLKSQGVNIAPVSQQQQQQQPPPASNNFFAAPSPSTYIMTNSQPTALSQPQPFEDSWFWKMGDLCMAKYWDDGRYYEAEITGVAEKTCVVFFLGYGNHEEVLKSDILPITDSQHRPVNMNPLLQQHQQQQQQSRYRQDRQGQQMYIPPHKREH